MYNDNQEIKETLDELIAEIRSLKEAAREIIIYGVLIAVALGIEKHFFS